METASSATGVATPPPPTYDVLDIVTALSTAGVDVAVVDAVADAVGHLAVSSLDVWVSCGVPPMKGIAARRLLAPCEDHNLVWSWVCPCAVGS